MLHGTRLSQIASIENQLLQVTDDHMIPLQLKEECYSLYQAIPNKIKPWVNPISFPYNSLLTISQSLPEMSEEYFSTRVRIEFLLFWWSNIVPLHQLIYNAGMLRR